MKLALLFLTLFFLISCENPVEKSNERIINQIYTKRTEIQEHIAQFRNDIINSGYSTLLSPDRLKQDRNHEESKKIIKKVEYIFNSYNQKNQTLWRDWKNLFDSIQPTEKINQKDIERLKNNFDEASEMIKSIYESDSTLFEINVRIFKLIDEDCKYDIIDNQIIFFNEFCLYTYNTLLANLNLEEIKITTRQMKLESEKMKSELETMFLEEELRRNNPFNQ